MLDRILQRLVSGYDRPDDPNARSLCGALAGWVGVGLNLLLFLGKLAAGLLTGAISITADAFNNLSDAAGSLVTLAGFYWARQEADAQHPFGHGRIEYLAGLLVSLLILLVGVELGRSSIEKILHPQQASFTVLSVIVLASSILVKLWMAWFDRTMGKRTNSAALRAAAIDAQADAMATGGVLVGLIVSQIFALTLDGWLGLLVAGLILRSGWSAAKDTLDPLLGQPPDPRTVKEIEALILSYPQVCGIHDLIIHDYGPGRRMMSVHVEIPAQGSLVEVHRIIDRIERELASHFHMEAVIHMDPIQIGDPQMDQLRLLIEGVARELDCAATIHDFHMEGSDQLELRFDVVVPYDVPLTNKEVRAVMVEKLLSRNPDWRPVIGVDRSHVL